VRDLWTHGSTAIEGDALALGETKFVIEGGLTVCAEPLGEADAVVAYARLHLGFVHIHPFWDGNGRMARLLANLPVLRAGYLPVVIEVKDRKRYIDTLATYQRAAGQFTQATGVWPRPDLGYPFTAFCSGAYGATQTLIAQAWAQQVRRAQRA
jgi:hypothetical protein